jgi:hypothetical protein
MRSIFEDMALRSFLCIKLVLLKAASLGTDADYDLLIFVRIVKKFELNRNKSL